MKYDFDEIINRKGTDCFKWDFMDATFGKTDLLPFWVADMDFESPPDVIEELIARAKHGVFGYPFRKESYYQSIIDWYQRRHGVRLERDWIVNSPGVVPGICFIIQFLTKPGDMILTHSPVYDPFFHSIKDNDRKLITSSLINNNGHFEMDYQDMEEKFKLGAKMMILCSPHNPVGRVWEKAELQKLIDLCVKYDIYLISDEIHSDLIFRGNKHYVISSIDEKINNKLIFFHAPSKTFNVAGLSTAFGIIINKEIRNQFIEFLSKNHLFIGNIFGNVALESCFNKGELWLEELNIYLKSNYDYICDFLAENIPNIKPSKEEGTYLLWLDFNDLGIDSDTMKKILVEEAGLAITDGRQYGLEGDGFLRFNFGCSKKLIEKALMKFKLSLEKRNLI